MPYTCSSLYAVAQLLTRVFFTPYLSTNICPQPGFARTSFHVTLHHLLLFTHILALDLLLCYWDAFTQHRDVSASIMLSTIISKGFNSLITALQFLLKMYCSDKCLNDAKSVKPFFVCFFLLLLFFCFKSETSMSKQHKSGLKPLKVLFYLQYVFIGPELKYTVAKSLEKMYR